jgi:site-specific recombinase XerD
MEMPLFYVSTNGVNHSLSDDTVQNILKKNVDQCRYTIEMPEKVHFHMIRKTRAMDLYQAGCPLSYSQQLLGHENISTTSGVYAFATLKTLADSIEKANPSGNEEKKWKNKDVLKKLYRL